MAQLAIKGHAARGEEVIEILEMLGGSNPHKYCAECDSLCFYIGKNTNSIYYDWVRNCYEDENTLVFTLEEFLEKFPYKVGDKVEYDYWPCVIQEMCWDNEFKEIRCTIKGIDFCKYCSVSDLKPHKEETMQEPKELLIGFIKDKDGNWVLNTHKDYEIKEVDGKFMLLRKNPQYPKTYEECAKVLLERASVRNDIGYKGDLIIALQRLLVCRDAYWKIEGWNPQVKGEVFYIHSLPSYLRDLLPMPTVEMRDAFLENFKKLIEHAKELL